MTVKSNHVTIKGTKDGLIFLLNDQCEFIDLVEDLRYKLEHSHQNILTGPIVHVDVKLGSREVSDIQKNELLDVLKSKGNLLIRSVDMPEAELPESNKNTVTTMTGMVRSGQVLHHEGHLLFLGDVNPGGSIQCTGDIFIVGALRGMAHAGVDGQEDAIVAASFLAPTQLRIAEVISRPPDEWENRESSMEFAYLQDGVMQIDKITNIVRIRPDLSTFKGV
ncbi:septum site-determining protein MinC [Paenibacillus shirakamiensis]|uniref:Probable septum site-determining protein MinC n=1 Tax=Paenibacillus shirakamiensis TaxID=1265935 RepID=A0ABS4JIJ4_9BACL|nr:septum site-determining protein MinC [Paenibacillus shirakamiensis]MBP2000399.1 septum site-determining protein MinC [Paenibacillus shirakamiensis]